SERVTGNLRHREEMQDLNIEAVQAARREVCDDVVVENRREERAADELRKCHVGMAQNGHAANDEALQLVEEAGARQQRDRQEQRKQKVVLRILLRGFP